VKEKKGIRAPGREDGKPQDQGRGGDMGRKFPRGKGRRSLLLPTGPRHPAEQGKKKVVARENAD